MLYIKRGNATKKIPITQVYLTVTAGDNGANLENLLQVRIDKNYKDMTTEELYQYFQPVNNSYEVMINDDVTSTYHGYVAKELSLRYQGEDAGGFWVNLGRTDENK